VSQTCHILFEHCGLFSASLGGRWASSRPLEVQFRGRSGGICRVRLSYFQPSPWSMNDALGCCGVLHACRTLWAHCRPFDVSLEGRWASLRPSKALFRGKCGDVWGGSSCRLLALSLVSERCPGVSRRALSLPHTVGTLWTLRYVFGWTLGFTAALGSPVQRQERRCL
jgi:hypothetical protein